MKALHTFVAVLGISIAGGAAYWAQNRGNASDAGPVAQAAVERSPTGAVLGGRAPVGKGGGAGEGDGATTGPAGGSAIAVEVAKVEAMTLADDAQAVGSLRSIQSVVLRPEVSGRITRIGFTDGQRVRSGQLLVQLDDTLQLAQLQQAQAQASIARVNLQRNQDLVAQNYVSRSTLDQSSAAMEVAQAQVALAQANLARMRITAPFDGVVGIRSVNVGDYVKDGAELVSIEDSATMFVDFRLPERYLTRLRLGQAITANLDALPGRDFAGKVEAVDSQFNADGRSLLVRASIGNPGGLLKPGMFARVRAVFSVREGAMVVPEEALVPQGNKQYLIKVIDGGDGKKRSQRIEAQIGMRMPGRVEIMQGLSVGDTVVTAGQSRLLRGDGLPVQIVEIAPPADAAGSAAGRGASGVPAGRPMTPRSGSPA
jgi:membrane fusion protein (multidrug efflux system)